MGTLVATAGAPQWSAARWARKPRLLRWFWLALLAHLAALWWLAGQPLPAPPGSGRPAISVELVPGSAPPLPPAPVPADPRPAAEPLEPAPPAPQSAEPIAASPADSSEPGPTVSLPPAGAPPEAGLDRSDPPPTAQDLLKRLRRYRVDDGPRLTPTGPEPRRAPSELGLANQTNMLAELDRRLPELPFAPGEMGLPFYSAGVRGDIARTFDRITPEFGFVTSFGLEVKCRYVLILVSCGWRER